MSAPVLEVEGLEVRFRTPAGTVHAVGGIDYSLARGETLGILGESGSGKSVQAQAVMGLLESPPATIEARAIRLAGRDLLGLPERETRRVRGKGIAIVFQDAITSLNPGLTVGFQIAEMFRVHEGADARTARRRAVELMDRVRIPQAAERARDYPYQFSGGMCQRVMIAMAIALDPFVLIADEPTTALDVTVQAQIMALLAELQAERGMALVLITHDLGVVAESADRVAVMYAGRIVETGPVDVVLANPAHPYTRGLLDSVPRAEDKNRPLSPIPGAPPVMTRLPEGCAFHPRCPRARPACLERVPPLEPVAPGRASACLFAREVLRV